LMALLARTFTGRGRRSDMSLILFCGLFGLSVVN
jgi:hypothetical protein